MDSTNFLMFVRHANTQRVMHYKEIWCMFSKNIIEELRSLEAIKFWQDLLYLHKIGLRCSGPHIIGGSLILDLKIKVPGLTKKEQR